MPDAIEANPRAVIGDNSPPLADQLAIDTAQLEKRADDLVVAAAAITVTDLDTAQRATAAAGMIAAHVDEISKWHKARKAPAWAECQAIDARKNTLVAKLATLDSKGKVVGGPLAAVLGQVDAFRRAEQARADAERRRLEEEARIEREKAEAAALAQAEAERREARGADEAEARVRLAEKLASDAGDWAAEEAAAAARANQRAAEAEASQRRMAAELDARRAQEAADTARRQAEAAAAPARINSGMGAAAHGRKVVVVTITDLAAAVAHCIATAEPEVRAVAQTILERQARAKIRTLPGATVTEDTVTNIRRSA